MGVTRVKIQVKMVHLWKCSKHIVLVNCTLKCTCLLNVREETCMSIWFNTDAIVACIHCIACPIARWAVVLGSTVLGESGMGCNLEISTKDCKLTCGANLLAATVCLGLTQVPVLIHWWRCWLGPLRVGLFPVGEPDARAWLEEHVVTPYWVPHAPRFPHSLHLHSNLLNVWWDPLAIS